MVNINNSYSVSIYVLQSYLGELNGYLNIQLMMGSKRAVHEGVVSYERGV